MSYNLLFLDDNLSFLKSMQLIHGKRHQVYLSSNYNEAKSVLATKEIDLILLDINLEHESGIDILASVKAHYPDIQVMMLSAERDPKQIVTCMKLGACEYLTKDTSTLEMSACIEKALNDKNIKDKLNALIEDTNTKNAKHNLVGSSKELKTVLQQADKVKGHMANILIDGETGTGKEVLARYIHSLEPGKNRPFIAVNCAAFPDSLIESELFGHEKGAFTSAVNRKLGKIELANNGDLFLDEINSLKPETQAKLLRVLEDKSIYRVGGIKPIKVNFRLIVASNEDLLSLVQQKRFREDLFHRLNVIRLTMPPLRNRPDDVIELTKHFMLKYCDKYKKDNLELSDKVIEALLDYDWPGNVRELENIIQSLVIMANSKTIDIHNLPQHIIKDLLGENDRNTSHYMQLNEIDSNTIEIKIKVPKVSLPKIKRIFEREYVNRILHDNNGHKANAAKQLGVSRTAFYKIMGRQEMQ